MRISKKLTFAILVSALAIFGQGMLGSSFGRVEAMQASYQDLQPDAFMKSWLILGAIPVFPEDSESRDMELQKKAFAADLLTQHGGESVIAPEADMVHKIGEKEFKWQLFESKDDIGGRTV
jgi:hypothetical protein